MAQPESDDDYTDSSSTSSGAEYPWILCADCRELDLDYRLECLCESTRVDAELDAHDVLSLFESAKRRNTPLDKDAFSGMTDYQAAQACADPEDSYECSTTAAHYLAEANAMKALRLVVEHSPEIVKKLCGQFPKEARRPASVTPIFHAACAGSGEAFDFLASLSPKFNCNAKDGHGRTVIELCSSAATLRWVIDRWKPKLEVREPRCGEFDFHPVVVALNAKDWPLCLDLLRLPKFRCSLLKPCLSYDSDDDTELEDEPENFFYHAIRNRASNDVLDEMKRMIRRHHSNPLDWCVESQQSALLVVLQLRPGREQLRILKCLVQEASWNDFQHKTPSAVSRIARRLAREMAGYGPNGHEYVSSPDVNDAVQRSTADSVARATVPEIALAEAAEIAEDKLPTFGETVWHLAAKNKPAAKVLILAAHQAWREEHGDLSPAKARNAFVRMLVENKNSCGEVAHDRSDRSHTRSLSNSGSVFETAIRGLLADDTTEGVSSPASEDESELDRDSDDDREDPENDDVRLQYRDGMNRAWQRIDAHAAGAQAAAAGDLQLNPLVAAVRGTSFNGHFITPESRRKTRRRDPSGKPVYSMAAASDADSAQAGRNAQRILAALESSGPLTFREPTRRTRYFNNANSFVQQFYTNSYSRTMTVLREIHGASSGEDLVLVDPLSRLLFPLLKLLDSPLNPIVSTSQATQSGVRNAALYAFGGARDAGPVAEFSHSFRPKLTMDRTGVYFKHPVAGLLSLFLFRPSDLAQGKRANHVRAMHAAGEIKMKNAMMYAHAQELAIFGFVEGDNHKWCTPVMLPDFRDAVGPPQYSRWYGLSKLRYTRYRERFVAALKIADAAGREMAIVKEVKSLTEAIASHLADVLQQLTRVIARESGAPIAFIDDSLHLVDHAPDGPVQSASSSVGTAERKTASKQRLHVARANKKRPLSDDESDQPAPKKAKASSVATSSSSSSAPRRQPWTCSECGSLNASNHRDCQRTPPPASGKMTCDGTRP